MKKNLKKFKNILINFSLKQICHKILKITLIFLKTIMFYTNFGLKIFIKTQLKINDFKLKFFNKIIV